MKTIKFLSWRLSTWTALIAILGLSYGCGSISTTSQATIEPSATTQPTLILSPSPTTSQEAEVKTLPRAYGPPKPLDIGSYQTDPSFSPQVLFSVPAGWYGEQGTEGFGIGQGIDTVEERFSDGGIYVDLLAMPLDEAVTAFQSIGGLDTSQSQTTQLGGYLSVTFHPQATRQVVLEDALGLGIDVSPNTDQVIFVDVEDTTVLIRTEVFNEEGRSGVADVLKSFLFSP